MLVCSLGWWVWDVGFVSGFVLTFLVVCGYFVGRWLSGDVCLKRCVFTGCCALRLICWGLSVVGCDRMVGF